MIIGVYVCMYKYNNVGIYLGINEGRQVGLNLWPSWVLLYLLYILNKALGTPHDPALSIFRYVGVQGFGIVRHVYDKTLIINFLCKVSI